MSGLDINQLFGLPASEIFSALSVSMLIKAPGNIITDTGIKRVIAAKDNVNLPSHRVKQPFQKWHRRLR